MSHPRFPLESEVQFGKDERIMTVLNQFDILDSYWEVVIAVKECQLNLIGLAPLVPCVPVPLQQKNM